MGCELVRQNVAGTEIEPNLGYWPQLKVSLLSRQLAKLPTDMRAYTLADNR